MKKKKLTKNKIKQEIDGGWTRYPISASFYKKLNILLLEEGGVDYTNSPRLEITIVDRTNEETLRYKPIKYSYQKDANYKDILESLLYNARISNEQLEKFINCYGSTIIKDGK